MKIEIILERIEDNKPEDGQYCLVVDDYGIWLIMQYDSDIKAFINPYDEDSFIEEEKITYWAELPDIK